LQVENIMSDSKMYVRHRGGYIGVFGDQIDALAQEATDKVNVAAPQTSPYHITLLAKYEIKQLMQESRLSLETLVEDAQGLDTSSIFPLGVGGDPKKVCWMVMIWNAGNLFRKKCGLSCKHFHVTLSHTDEHDIDKGVRSLRDEAFTARLDGNQMDHLVLSCNLSGELELASRYALEMCGRFSHSSKGWVRLGDLARQRGESKLAMLCYAQSLQCAHENLKLRDYSMKKLVQCHALTELGCLFADNEYEQVPDELRSMLLSPWPQSIQQVAMNIYEGQAPQLAQIPRTHLLVPYSDPPCCDMEAGLFSLPRFFSWVVPFFLAGMSTPRSEADISALSSPHLGVRHVVTLTEEEPLPEAWFQGKTISNTHLPVTNYHAPSIEQVDYFLRLLNDPSKTPLLVHCGGGKGRAGTLLACYIAVYGFQPPWAQDWSQPAMSAGEAIAKIRQLRPGSLETEEQEKFVHSFVSTVWRRQAALPQLPEEPQGLPLEIEGAVDENADLVILCGLPGSGKSHVAKMMAMRDERWLVVSQDESRSREACEQEISRPGKHGRVVLDRCNPDQEDRRRWLALAQWARKPVCVYFDYEEDLCVARAQQRVNHPTLTPGHRVLTAVESMRRRMQRPRLAEGFAGVCRVRSFDAANELIGRLTPVGICKFVRTGHLINLGAATSDDIVLKATSSDHDVVITEKVDGANLGFSLSNERMLLVQNRSHYISSATHAQFRPLDDWVEEHREGLYRVLDRDPSFPERFILYGEWLVATHSIPYTHLPDRVLAFDLYDRSSRTWADRDSLARLLEGTGISMVPVLYRGARPSEQRLREMVHLPSLFYEGPVEGIYVKEEKDGRVISRGKIVRGDFTAGITEHWEKARLRKNGILRGEVEDEEALE